MSALGSEATAQVVRDLEALAATRERLLGDLAEAEAATTEIAARDAVFSLANRTPSVRSIGLLSSLSEQERAALLPSLAPDPGSRTLAQSLIARITARERLHAAFCTVLPESFALPGREDWARYRERLRGLPDEPIWGETDGVGIARLYVPPRYQLERRVEHDDCEQPGPEEGQDPLPLLSRLLTDDVPDRAPVFVVGGPGLGKSSLVAMLGARVAEEGALDAVVVRLREIDPRRPILDEVRRLLGEQGFPCVSRHLTAATRPTLLLDGFDELAHASHGDLSTFFYQIKDLLQEMPGLRVLLTGRDTLFERRDTAFPLGSAIVRLLPFTEEQVGAWCENWSVLTGRRFDARPLARSKGPLAEIASQPLMLYMLAKMGERGLDLTGTADLTQGRAGVYRRIIDWTCRRHEELRPNDPWKASHMRRFLRVAGYVAMVRSTEVLHLSDLEVGLRAAGLALDPAEQRFQAEKTILAFAFRTPSQQAWEFTHKSFGEYLAAEYLAAACHRIVEEAEDELGERGYRLGVAEATREWLRAFGVVFVTGEVEQLLVPMLPGFSRFLGGKQPDMETVRRLRERLSAILVPLLDETEAEEALAVARAWGERPLRVRGFAIANLVAIVGLPFGDLEYRFEPEAAIPGRFRELYQAVQVLGRAPGTMGRLTERLSLGPGALRTLPLTEHLAWCGAFLPFARIRGPMQSPLAGAFLQGADLAHANLANSRLRGAILVVANLREAHLSAADLRGANLFSANLRGADLRNADLRGADLRDADLRGADLRGAKLDPDLADAQIDESTLLDPDLIPARKPRIRHNRD